MQIMEEEKALIQEGRRMLPLYRKALHHLNRKERWADFRESIEPTFAMSFEIFNDLVQSMNKKVEEVNKRMQALFKLEKMLPSIHQEEQGEEESGRMMMTAQHLKTLDDMEKVAAEGTREEDCLTNLDIAYEILFDPLTSFASYTSAGERTIDEVLFLLHFDFFSAACLCIKLDMCVCAGQGEGHQVRQACRDLQGG